MISSHLSIHLTCFINSLYIDTTTNHWNCDIISRDIYTHRHMDCIGNVDKTFNPTLHDGMLSICWKHLVDFDVVRMLVELQWFSLGVYPTMLFAILYRVLFVRRLLHTYAYVWCGYHDVISLDIIYNNYLIPRRGSVLKHPKYCYK
jgi:hypothetical protein